MPSAPVRFAIEAAFFVLVAVGAALAKLELLVIVLLVAVAGLLVALVERAYAREAARASVEPQPSDDTGGAAVETAGDVDPRSPAAGEPAEPQREPEPEPELAVSERSARAILATGPPPVSEQYAPRTVEPEPAPQAEVALRDPEAEPQPEPEPEPEAGPQPDAAGAQLAGGPPREWNVWDLQRLVRERPEDDRQEEWTALLVSLREFARADGTLPLEFDDLVRESFGSVLADGARTAAASR